jgi:hypothetical protein
LVCFEFSADQFRSALAAALVVTAASAVGPFRTLLWFLAGVGGSLGKSEWALALASASLTTFALAVAVSRDRVTRRLDYSAVGRSLDVCGSVLLGILFGQLVVLVYAPTAYFAGFELMRQVTAMPLSVAQGLMQSWTFAYPVFITITVALVLIAVRLRHYCQAEPEIVMILVWAAAIAAGYIYSGWNGDGFPRYYCPAALLVAIGLVCLLRNMNVPRMWSALALATLVAGVGLNGASLIHSCKERLAISSFAGMSLEQARTRYLKLAQNYRGVPVLEWSAFSIYFRDIDWVATDMGSQAAIEFVQEHRPEVQAEFAASARKSRGVFN